MTDIDDLIARLELPSSDLRPYWMMCKEAAAALREQRDEIARLTKLEQECWTSPEQWMKWCDIRVLERAERAEAELDAAMKDAERYRWLRDESWKHDSWSVKYTVIAKRGEGLDAAIDAALAAFEKEQKR